MGCCASAANEIHVPNNANNKNQNGQNKDGQDLGKGQLQKKQNKDDQDSEIYIENQEQVHTDQNNYKQVEFKQISPKGSQQNSKNPYEYQENQIEKSQENFEQQVENEKEELDGYTSNVRKEVKSIREFIQRKKLLRAQIQQDDNQQININIIEEVERLIQNKQLRLDSLNEICQDNNKSLIEVLSLMNQQNYYLIELILIYIDDYEIIQHALLNHQFPNEFVLQAIAIRLINKMKPLFSTKEKIYQTITFIKSIFNSDEVIRMLNSLEFSNIDSYIDMKNKDHLKLFGCISKLFQKSQIKGNIDFLQKYKEARKNYYFLNLIVPKSIPLGLSDVEYNQKVILQHLQFNIFHQIALDKRWDIFLQYANKYYITPNISQVTPIMMLFQEAPFNIIDQYITLYPDLFLTSLSYFTNSGKNLIHCICLNKNRRSIEEIQQIINKFNNHQDSIQYLLVQPYNEQIPLVTYLDCQNEPQEIFIEFLSQYVEKEFDFFQIYLNVLKSSVDRNQLGRKCRINPSLQYFYSKQNEKTRKRFRIENYEEKDYQQFDIFYYQYVQVAKQLIKHKFKLNLNWIQNFDVHSSHYPYEFSGVARPLLILLIQQGYSDLVMKQVDLIKPLYYNQQIEDINKNMVQSQFISKLLQIIKFAPDRSQLNPLIKQIIESIKLNPQLLKIPLVGYFDVRSKQDSLLFRQIDQRYRYKLYNFDSIYNQLIELNEQSLDQCYCIEGLQFQQNEHICLQIIRKLFLNNKLLKVDDQFLNEIYKNITFSANFQQESNSYENQEEEQRIFYKKSNDPPIEQINNINYYKIFHTDKSTHETIYVSLLLKKFNDNKGPVYNFKEFIQFLRVKKFEYFVKQKSLFDNICILDNNEKMETLIKLYFDDNFRLFPSGLHLLSDYFEISANSKRWSSSLFIYAKQILFDYNFILESEKTINFTIFNIKENQLENCYNWFMAGMNLTLIKLPQINPDSKNYKEKAAYYALSKRKPFLAALITIKECYQDLTTLYPKDKITKDIINILSFKDIINNKSFENLNYILNFNQIPKSLIVYTLAKNYFALNANNSLKQNQEEINKFNEDLQLLFSNLKQNEDQIQGLLTLQQNIHCFSFLNLKSLQIFKPNFDEMNYSEFRDILLSCHDIEVKIAIINNIPENVLQYFGSVAIKIINKNQELFDLLIKRLLSVEHQNGTLNLLKSVLLQKFDQNPSKSLDVLFQIIEKEDSKYKIPFIQHLYSLSYRNKDVQSLNRLLAYLDQDPEKNNYNMGFILRNQFSIDDEYKNYYLALRHPPCVVLNTNQYKIYLEQNKFDKLKLQNDYLFCIREGLYEKIQILNKLIGSFDQIKEKGQFCQIIGLIMIEAKIEPYNQSLRDNQSLLLFEQFQEMDQMQRYQFFHLNHEYTLVRKQLRQKYSVSQIIQRAQEIYDKSKRIINHPVKKLEYLNNQECSITFAQNQAYSKQNQNYSSLFQSSYNSQQQNYEKCFEIFQKWANQKTVCQVSSFYEFSYALRYPNKQQVQQKEQLVEILIKFFFNKKGPKFLISKSKEYIQLLKANWSNQFSKYIKQDFYNIRPQFLELFVQEFICEDKKYDPSYEELNYIMMIMKYQNIKLVPIMKKKYKGLQQNNFNQATLFYAKNEVNLLQETSYDVSIKRLDKRMQFFSRFISGVGANLKKLTPIQVYILFGKHNHILQKPQFTYENLMLALMSGNLDTITYIIQLSQQPNKIVYEQNIFQLIVYSNYNDNVIIKFFNKYIKDYVKQTNRIFLFDNQPILYYIMLMRKQKLFEDLYLPFMIQIHGEQKAVQLLKEELLSPCGGNNSQDILSLALMRKNYFILNYCSGIINKEHLKFIQHYDINFFQQIKTQNNNSPHSKFMELYQKYLPLCNQQLEFKQYEKSIVQSKYSNIKYKLVDQKQINVKESQIIQLIKYEQACINQVFNLNERYYFHNKQLTIQMVQDKWDILEWYKFDPTLLQQVLLDYKQPNGSYNLKDEEYLMILEKCQKYQLYQHPIYDELSTINPKLFLEITNPTLLTISSVVAINKSLYKTSELFNYVNYHYQNHLENDKLEAQQKIQKEKSSQQNLNRSETNNQNENEDQNHDKQENEKMNENENENEKMNENQNENEKMSENQNGDEKMSEKQNGDEKMSEKQNENENEKLSENQNKNDISQIVQSVIKQQENQEYIYEEEDDEQILRNSSVQEKENLQSQQDDQQKHYLQKNIAYAFYLLLCIQNDDYQGLQVEQQQLKVIVELIQHLQKSEWNIKQQKPFITPNSRVFLLSQLNQNQNFKDFQYFEQIIENENSKELAILKGILYIQQINEIVKGFIDILSEEIKTINNFKKNVILVIGNEQITYVEDVFTIPLQYSDKSFNLSEDSIAQAIPQLKMANYQMNIDFELIQYQEIQEQWPNFDFSSITTVDFQEIIINSKENVMEKCLFFKSLMEKKFDPVGIYQIDDVFAPHQHEQVRQTEIQQFQGQMQPPSLIHQSQSQIGTSQGNQMQRQQSLINQQQIMKEDFQFMFELLPDNTYQVRQQKQKKNQKELIFAEFYNFNQPKVVINLIKLSEEEFVANYNGTAIISIIIQDFYRYNEYLSNLIEQKEEQVWKLDFPFYIKNQQFVYQDQLFSTYNIQMIFNKLVEFIEKVQQLLGRCEDQIRLVWRINTISFLEVIVSKLVELQQANNKVINIYSIIHQVFSWDTLIMILHQLLYNNLIKAQQVLKVIRGVYVEFNEQQGVQFVESDQKRGLDKIFQFGNTTYLLYNHILIIRLNIVTVNNIEKDIKLESGQKLQQNSRSVFKPNPITQEYFHSIINEYDFYNQIFNPEQLVQYLFNKLDIDRHLLNYSNQLSKKLNKTITLSVDHQSLAQIFSSEIYKISQNKNSKIRLNEMEQIWYILLKLNKYFKEDLYNYIQRQLNAEKFDDMFNIRLSCLLSALRQNQPLANIIVSNTRQLKVKQKSKILQQLGQVTHQNEIKISYHFGFQIQKNYYVNNSKLGDICLLVYCENQKNHLVACQLIYNSKPGHLLFLLLDCMSSQLLTQDRITRNQVHYSGCTYSHQELLYVQIEDIMSIVLFSPIWPSDPVFNQSILNVFFTDQDGNISICNEPKFLTIMSQIQCEQDEFNKQDMLDNLFGNGLVSSYSDLSLTQLTPIFPDQINFDFAAIHQLKKQQSLVQGQTVFVRIIGDKFKLDQIEIPQVSMACHFETNVSACQQLKDLMKFLNNNEELGNVFLHFDDQMNHNPELYEQNILSGGSIFEAFQYGYQTFKDGYSYPKLNNSLQYLFELESIQSLKIIFIKTFIKKIEFIFEKSFESQKQLIQYENGNLKLYTLVDDNDNVQVPDSIHVTQFLFNLIFNFKQNNMSSYITDQNLQIQDIGEIQIESIKTVVDILMLIKYLFKLLTMFDKNIKLNVSILGQKQIKTQFKNTMYQFEDDGSHLIINYDTFTDFNICDFFLDYLNNKQFYMSNRYNEKIKYEGPEIIFDNLDLNPNQLLSGIEKNSQVELLIFNLDKGRLQDLHVLDPNLIDQVFLIFKVDGIYQKFQVLKCCTHKSLIGYLKQTTFEQTISNSLFLLIHNLDSKKQLETQLNKVEVEYHKSKNTNLMNIIRQEKKKQQIQVSYKFITNRIILVEFFSDKTLTMKFKVNQQMKLSMIQNQLLNQIIIEYTTQSAQDLSKTKHLKVTIQGVEKLIEIEQEEQLPFGKGDAKIMKILLKKQPKTLDEVILHKQFDPITHSKDLQLSNTINMLSKQELSAASRAGEERNDLLEFKDNLGNKIQNYNYSTLVLVHSLFNQVQYTPKLEKSQDGLHLIWTPIFKGVYKLFIDDVRIRGRFIVLANTPDLQESEIEIPQELNTIPFYEDIPFTFQLRDLFSNIYGDIENDTYLDCQCDIQCTSGVTIKVNFQNIQKSGSINAKAHFSTENVEETDRQTEIVILINGTVKKIKPIMISGVCLEKRRKKFEGELEKSFKRTDYSLVIRRMNFLKELLNLVDTKMNFRFDIKFQDEPGIDAGGLKREFYDMIGNTLKDDTYKFFQPVQGNLSKYFLHSNFNKIKNKKEYALLFGKLVANAIGNGYLIGIDIISPFWKVVYDEKIVFEDLRLVWDKQTYANYEHLKSMKSETIESLYLDFTYQLGNQTIELIPNGSNMPVTSKNVHQYLDKTAEYIIYKQFQDIYKSFIEGFKSVLDLTIFQRWLKPHEMSLLTQGLLEIKPDVILSKITYTGGKANHKSYFENYVNQADSQTLKNMLKFITGSSAIPFDQSSYIIQVDFKSNLEIRKLPLAHTCFKSIEIPLYTNFAQMKQKLDIAFTIGLEGYGFG